MLESGTSLRVETSHFLGMSKAPAILRLIAIMGSNHGRTRWRAERAMATFGAIEIQCTFNTHIYIYNYVYIYIYIHISYSFIFNINDNSKTVNNWKTCFSFPCCNMLQRTPFGCISHHLPFLQQTLHFLGSSGESVCLAHFGINPT